MHNPNQVEPWQRMKIMYAPQGLHEKPFVGVSEARYWSHWLVFVGDYRQKLTNLLEIDF
jgi:hypothetical protein